MAPGEDQISQIDIYHKLGALEAKVDVLMSRVTDYSGDLGQAFNRLRELENKTSWALGVAATMSLVVPMVVSIAVANFDMKIVPQNTTSKLQ